MWSSTLGSTESSLGLISEIRALRACAYVQRAPPNVDPGNATGSGGPPDLLIARFDNYSGPTLRNGTVPITPLRRTWSSSGVQCSRLQLPLKLTWAITIHKSQGLTLNKVVIRIGIREFLQASFLLPALVSVN